MYAENELDEIINHLYFHTKDLELNSYEELHELLSNESLIEMIEKIAKEKY
jgi:predicted transcriptional regulator